MESHSIQFFFGLAPFIQHNYFQGHLYLLQVSNNSFFFFILYGYTSLFIHSPLSNTDGHVSGFQWLTITNKSARSICIWIFLWLYAALYHLKCFSPFGVAFLPVASKLCEAWHSWSYTMGHGKQRDGKGTSGFIHSHWLLGWFHVVTSSLVTSGLWQNGR